MRRSGAEILIGRRLLAELRPFGFRQRAAHHGVVRDIEGGWQSVSSGVRGYPSEYNASLAAVIRFDACELVRQQLRPASPRHEAAQGTLVFTPENIFGYRFEVQFSSEREAHTAADKIAAKAREVVVPFLDQRRMLADAEVDANDPSAPSYRAVRDGDEAETRLIMAKLAGQRPLDEVAERLRQDLADSPPWLMTPFEEMYTYLTSGDLPARLQAESTSAKEG